MGAIPTLPLPQESLISVFTYLNQKPVSALRSFVCCCLPRLLVRISATWSCVEIYFNSTSLALIFSLSQWYLISKCLVRSARHGFVAILMQACESSCNGTVSVGPICPSSDAHRQGYARAAAAAVVAAAVAVVVAVVVAAVAAVYIVLRD